MNEDLIKVKIRKLEKKVEESQEGYTEEFKKLFGFMCRHIERLELRLIELEEKICNITDKSKKTSLKGRCSAAILQNMSKIDFDDHPGVLTSWSKRGRC